MHKLKYVVFMTTCILHDGKECLRKINRESRVINALHTKFNNFHLQQKSQILSLQNDFNKF